MTGELEKLTLTLNPGESGERQYQIYPVQNVDINSRKDAFSVAPPGLSSSENILLGISGMQADITLSFTIWDDGTDRSNGTYTESVETVHEQIRYLEDVIHAPDFDASWELDHDTGIAFNDDEVFLESVEPTVFDADSGKWKPCRMTLRRGGSV